ncbi:MAG TPA: NAD-dependent epimerase/dehydratase family protein [Bryobacteraceae bacterium]|jgi:nucleoside-diphosphate-sugar epimerase|nr:NAD-dependent epimerase/dehydratase family protein [Bryobacteraceae bacterium]
MNFLLIGATGFIGKHVTAQLLGLGASVTVFHRGPTKLPVGAEEILGDHKELARHRDALRARKPDAVIDFILSNERQASELVDIFSGHAGRIVGVSSADVYRACGIAHGFESGPLQALPLTEDSALRTTRNVYGADDLARLRTIFSWLGEEYDKIPVEQVIMAADAMPGTVLRLPMVYGPCDPLHRLFPYLKRMDDQRPAILLQADAASWRGPRGYVENVAAAITLAAASHEAAGKIYNIAEQDCLSEADWIRAIAAVAEWTGEIVAMPAARLPAHLQVPYRTEQHWVVSSERIRRELAFREPVDFNTGLANTIAWERENPPPFAPAAFNYEAEDAALAAYLAEGERESAEQ